MIARHRLYRHAMLLTTAAAASTLLLSAPALAQQTCPDGEAARPWIGAHAFHCPGGACRYYALSEETSGPSYDFSSEPWLRAIDLSGPGFGDLQEGDVLVAVNGYLITTVRGGWELANLTAGEPARITLRRGNRLEHVEVTPQARCEPVMLLSGNTVMNVPLPDTPTADWDGVVRRPRGGGFHSGHSGVGAAFACSDCAIRFDDEDGFEWLATGPVEVRAVSKGSAAEEAGLRVGDRVISVNGRPMHTEAAGKAFFQAKAGDEMVLGIARDGRTFDTTVAVRASDLVTAEGSPGAVIRRGRGGWGGKTLGGVLSSLQELRESSRILRELREGHSGSAPEDDSSYRTRNVLDGMTISGDSWGPGALGATFSCGDECAWVIDNGRHIWQLRRYLSVKEVEPDGPADVAGLLPGDVLLSINGHDLLTPEAGDLFALARSGQKLELVVRRDSREVQLTLVAR